MIAFAYRSLDKDSPFTENVCMCMRFQRSVNNQMFIHKFTCVMYAIEITKIRKYVYVPSTTCVYTFSRRVGLIFLDVCVRGGWIHVSITKLFVGNNMHFDQQIYRNQKLYSTNDNNNQRQNEKGKHRKQTSHRFLQPVATKNLYSLFSKQ